MNYSDDDYYYSDDDEDEDEVNKQKEPERRDRFEPPKYNEENDYIEFIPNIKFTRNIKTGYITLDSFSSIILCRFINRDKLYNDLKTDPFIIELVNLFQSRYKKYAFVYKTSFLNPHFSNILACY